MKTEAESYVPFKSVLIKMKLEIPTYTDPLEA